MSPPAERVCTNCGATLHGRARYCPACGASVAPVTADDEVLLLSGRHLQVRGDALSLRELLALVESGVTWWQQRLQDADAVNREHAAAAIKDLSRILDSLSQQLAQGRETVRITTRLPAVRAYATACSVCGRGNRVGARYCISCGTVLPAAGAADRTTASLSLTYAGQTDRGQSRAENEDTYYTGALATSSGEAAILLVVADGMGGAQAGAVASQMATTVIKQELRAALSTEPPASGEAWQSLLRRTVQAANRQVYQSAHADSRRKGMGTTLTVAVAVADAVHLAHVGDTRAYLLNAAGVTDDRRRIVQLTTDHTLVARLVDIGHLTPEAARDHPQRNMLYRAVGTDPVVDVDTASHTLQTGDWLLLCSDGLAGLVSDDQMAQIVFTTADLAQACARLVALANQSGGSDNITAVLARAERRPAAVRP